MQPLRAIFGLCLCSISPVATAGTISNTVSYNGSADLGAQLTGPTFNPSFGTLTGVGLVITGSYDPNIFFNGFHQGRIPTNSQLDYSIFRVSGSFGTYNLSASTNQFGTTLSGPAEDFTISVNPTDVQDYVSLGNNQGPRALGFINLFSVAANGGWGGDFADRSVYSGNATITYTYTPVPEPSSLALLSIALAFLTFSHRERRASGLGKVGNTNKINGP